MICTEALSDFNVVTVSWFWEIRRRGAGFCHCSAEPFICTFIYTHIHAHTEHTYLNALNYVECTLSRQNIRRMHSGPPHKTGFTTVKSNLHDSIQWIFSEDNLKIKKLGTNLL